jgi:hypothetical protein
MAQQTLTATPSTWVNRDVGGIDWSTPSNAGASDDAYASVTTSAGSSSDFLRGTGLGFAVPPGATIDGFEVLLEGKQTGAGPQPQVYLVKNGTQSTGSAVMEFDATDSVKTVGSASSLFGETWIGADVMAANFGVEVQAPLGTTTTFNIDHIRVRVYYTPSALMQSGFIF